MCFLLQFEIINPEFAKMKIFVQNKKVSNLRLKMSFEGIFEMKFQKLVIYLEKHLRVFETAKFCVK